MAAGWAHHPVHLHLHAACGASEPPHAERLLGGPGGRHGPLSDQRRANLFRAEPIAVTAWGTRTQGFGFHDTVSVLLRFPEDQLAQFTVAYGLNAVDEYRIVGTDGDLNVTPGFGFGAGLRHTLDGGREQVGDGVPGDGPVRRRDRLFFGLHHPRHRSGAGRRGGAAGRARGRRDRAGADQRADQEELSPLYRSKGPRRTRCGTCRQGKRRRWCAHGRRGGGEGGAKAFEWTGLAREEAKMARVALVTGGTRGIGEAISTA